MYVNQFMDVIAMQMDENVGTQYVYQYKQQVYANIMYECCISQQIHTNNTPLRGKHPTPLQSHIVKQTNTTNPQNTPQHSQQCSGFTYYVTCGKMLCNGGCVRVCVRMNEVTVSYSRISR